MNDRRLDSEALGDAAQAYDSLDAERAFAAVSANLLGRPEDPPTIGRFQVERRVGSGGMGVVYAAVDPKLDRRVAIKVLRTDVGAAGQERLLREARALARLNHPNIVSVHEVGTIDERVFIAMELVEGIPMSAWLRTPRSWTEVAPVALDAGRGLAAAHEAGIIHRDFKPANVVLRPDGRAVVLDFGLARQTESTSPSQDATSLHGHDVGDTATKASSIAGTPAYMAPEQHLGLSATAQSDQFAFCVSVYEALYGQRPFESATRMGLLQAIDEGRFRPPPQSRAVPRWFRQVLLRGLASAQPDRWPSMEALLAVIERRTVPLGRRLLVPVLVAGLAGTGVLLATKSNGPSCAQQASEIDSTWNPAVATGLLETLGAVDHPASSRIPPVVVAQLDTYTKGWKAQWEQACLADAEQPNAAAQRTMACLEGQQAWLGSALAIFESPNDTVLTEATRLVPDSGSLLDCRAPEESTSPTLTSGPDEHRAHVERVINEVDTLAVLGRWSEAGALLDSLADEADPALRSRAARARGMLYRRRADRESARDALEEAVLEAERAGDTTARLSAMRALATELAEYGNHEEAARALAQVEAAHERYATLPWTWRAELLVIRAHLHRETRDIPSAVEAASDLLALVQKEAPDNLGRQLRARHLVLRARMEGSEREGIKQELFDLLADTQALYGPDHELTATLHSNLGVQLFYEGDPTLAAKHTRTSIEIRERLGEEEAAMLGAMGNLAAIESASGSKEAAIETWTRIIEITRAKRPDHDKRLLRALNNLGGAYGVEGRFGKALTLTLEELELSKEVYGEKSPQTVLSMVTAAKWMVRQANFAGAVEVLEQAQSIEQTSRGTRTEAYARVLIGLANVYFEWGYPDRIRPLAEEAFSILATEKTQYRIRVEANLLFITGLLHDAQPADLERARSLMIETKALLEHPRAFERHVKLFAAQTEELAERLGDDDPLASD